MFLWHYVHLLTILQIGTGKENEHLTLLGSSTLCMNLLHSCSEKGFDKLVFFPSLPWLESSIHYKLAFISDISSDSPGRCMSLWCSYFVLMIHEREEEKGLRGAWMVSVVRAAAGAVPGLTGRSRGTRRLAEVWAEGSSPSCLGLRGLEWQIWEATYS